jgi:ribose transport system permease protein
MTSVGSTGAVGTNARSGPVDAAIDFLLRYGAFIAILGVCAYFAVMSPVFLTPANALAILVQGAVLAIAAYGMSIAVIGGGMDIIQGGIDLSIGAQVGLVTAVDAVLMANGVNPIIAVLVGVLVGMLMGLGNGFAVAIIGIVPLLATLAMMNVAAGTELLITNNVNIPLNNDFIAGIANGSILFLPVPVVILVITTLAYWLFVERTPIGVQIRAIGGNRQAAMQSGIPVKRLIVLTYVLAGVAASIAAIIVLGRLSGSVRGIGPLMLLDLILAAQVSAMFSRRWVVNIPGTLIGGLLVAALSNGFTLVNIPGYWVLAVKGALILFVVSATALEKKRGVA